MSMASTIVIAREDLSIPGSEPDQAGQVASAGTIEGRFFDLIRDQHPDVVVLDLVVTTGHGIAAIRKIRQRCGVPILVVCDAQDTHIADYRIAGAAGCLNAPIDISELNTTIQRIIKVTQFASPPTQRAARTVSLAGIDYLPDHSELQGPSGICVKLTTGEKDLLSHFLEHRRSVCSRAEIANAVYGRHRPVSDRAIDVLVNRLRKKLVSACGPGGNDLVRTEFRRGYVLVAEISTARSYDVQLGV